MKKLVVISWLFVFAIAAALGQSDDQDTEKPRIEFEKKVHDYGTIKHNGDGTYGFVFKNTGNKPLVLKRVKSSCGCTTPSWPRKPIQANARDTILVEYNTRITGKFSKSVYVYSNAEKSPVVLRIKGEVKRNQ